MRYVRVCLTLVLVSLGLVIFGHGQSVHAETGGYPYADTSCIWAPYQANSNTSFWCQDYDWGQQHDDMSAANVISPYGYYYRNCTDYTAWRVDSLGVSQQLYKGLGNAKDWAIKAAAKGVRVDATPAAGAVAVRTTGQYGHTAFVESVENGSITVSQYNYRADGNYSVATGTAQSFGFTAFIHFEDNYTQDMQTQDVVVTTEAGLPVANQPSDFEEPAIVLQPTAEATEAPPTPPIDQPASEGLLSDESFTETEAPQETILPDESPAPTEQQDIPAQFMPDENAESPPAPAMGVEIGIQDQPSPVPAAKLSLQISQSSPPSNTPDLNHATKLAQHSQPQYSAVKTDFWPIAGLTMATLLGHLLPPKQRFR